MRHAEATLLNKSDVIVGLDIGNTKVSALVCEVGASDNLEVIGIGTSPSVGLRKGDRKSVV